MNDSFTSSQAGPHYFITLPSWRHVAQIRRRTRALTAITTVLSSSSQSTNPTCWSWATSDLCLAVRYDTCSAVKALEMYLKERLQILCRSMLNWVWFQRPISAQLSRSSLVQRGVTFRQTVRRLYIDRMKSLSTDRQRVSDQVAGKSISVTMFRLKSHHVSAENDAYSPSVNNIWAVMIVRKIRGKISRTVLCCIRLWQLSTVIRAHMWAVLKLTVGLYLGFL